MTDWREFKVARNRALDRLGRARNPIIREWAEPLVGVEDSIDHYRWLARAPMWEITGWGMQIVRDVTSCELEAE